MTKRNGQPTAADARAMLEQIVKLSTRMVELSERRPDLEPVLLNLARAGGLRTVEKHIMGLRKYRVRARQAGKK